MPNSPTSEQARERVALLLAFLDDVSPAVRAGRPWADRGEAPSRRVPCPDCEGTGRQTWRERGIPKSRECVRCSRRGWVEVDAYTLRDVRTAEAEAEPALKRVACDGCGGAGSHGNGRRCKHCAGVGYREVPTLTNAEPHEARSRPGDTLRVAAGAAGAAVAASLYERGSFRELERALARLPAWRRLLLKRDSSGLPERQRDDRAASLVMLTAYVIAETGGKIRVPRELLAWAADRDVQERQGRRPLTRGERNAAVRRLRAAGLSTGKIAEQLGVSRRTVQRVSPSA